MNFDTLRKAWAQRVSVEGDDGLSVFEEIREARVQLADLFSSLLTVRELLVGDTTNVKPLRKPRTVKVTTPDGASTEVEVDDEDSTHDTDGLPV